MISACVRVVSDTSSTTRRSNQSMSVSVTSSFTLPATAAEVREARSPPSLTVISGGMPWSQAMNNSGNFFDTRRLRFPP